MIAESFKLLEFATQAMMYEVSCFPSPGLVSPTSQGAHKDMDLYTFIDSTSVLSKYIFEFSEAGFNEEDLDGIFKEIREIGVRAENEMYKKTGGVNTHKGMIFLMGVVTATTSYVIKNKLEFNKIQDCIKSMCKGLTKELKVAKLKKENELSHGEKLYLQHGVLGVRGEAEQGIPLAFDVGLKKYEAECRLDKNDRLVETLIYIMSKCEDSTILHRHNFETLNKVKEVSCNFIKKGGIKNNQGKRRLEEMNEDFIDKNISPGGSADILAITVFLSLIKKEFF